MVVISLEHAPDHLKGWLCRYLYQIRPGLYVGTVNAKIRNLLWERINGTIDCKAAVMLWSDTNEQKFSFRIKGDLRRKLKDIEGVHWIYVDREITHLEFKAKTSTKKSLICHLLETGVTAKMLLTKGLLTPLVKQLSAYMKEDEGTVVQFISFVVAIHDIGKIHPHFQWEIENEIQGMENVIHEQLPFRHEQYGQDIIQKLDSDILQNLPNRVRELVGEIVALHHQGHKSGEFYHPTGKDLQICTSVQKSVIKILHGVFPFELNTQKWRFANGVASILSAIIILCDWIASTHDTYTEDIYQEGTEYLESLEHQAYRFIEVNYMLYQPTEERFRSVLSDKDFFRAMQIEHPRPLQEKMINLCKTANTESLMIVEASCGEGKTAAALFAASHIQAANGFYMALPTAATSEGVYGEVELLCNQADPQIKLPVFNGRAWMSEKDISIDTDLWISPSRQKMFYPVAIGTVDQLIKASLMIKYGLLRLLALLGKVVIIDEMHAYDIYMQDMIENFLAYCGVYHVPVVILSATLPSTIKEKLLSAYTGFGDKERQYIRNGAETTYEGKWNMCNTYPLITMASHVDYGKTIEITETPFPTSRHLIYRYQMISVGEEYVEEIGMVCMDKIKKGGCLAVIVNLVDEAKDLYRFLKDHADGDTEIYLLHGRNTEQNKVNASNEIKKIFGKDRSWRPAKSIVVSTQILEQSMDIDFDFMCSMLAPIDLLLQRFGRYRRHCDQGTIRERIDISSDEIFIFLPQGKTEKKHAMVYDKQILEKTTATLQKKTKEILKLPEETRDLIESVYGDNTLSIRDVKKQIKAEERMIPSPIAQEFLYYEEASSLKSTLDTRCSDIRTYDIAIVPEQLVQQLRGDITLELIKEIRKRYTVTGIPEYRLKKNEHWIFPEVELEKQKPLRGLLLYQETDGRVHGNGWSMWIDATYGLEFQER